MTKMKKMIASAALATTMAASAIIPASAAVLTVNFTSSGNNVGITTTCSGFGSYVTAHAKVLDGAVFCGTSGGQGGTEAMLSMLDVAKRIHGEKHKGELFNKLAFGSYNNGITPRNSDFDWLSRDTAVVAKYCNDKRCGFTFTLNGFENLVKMIWFVSNDKWYSSYPKNLPTYLISGSADPVGNYGKGVLKVFNNLNLNNCNVEMKIYKDARHELLNELNKDEVYADVLDFFETIME